MERKRKRNRKISKWKRHTSNRVFAFASTIVTLIWDLSYVLPVCIMNALVRGRVSGLSLRAITNMNICLVHTGGHSRFACLLWPNLLPKFRMCKQIHGVWRARWSENSFVMVFCRKFRLNFKKIFSWTAIIELISDQSEWRALHTAWNTLGHSRQANRFWPELCLHAN